MKRTLLSLGLGLASMLSCVSARASTECSDLMLRLLELSPVPPHSDQKLFLDSFRDEVDARFAELTPAQQELLLARVEATVFVAGNPSLYDTSPGGVMRFYEGSKGSYLMLPGVFHEWVHALDLVKRDTLPLPQLWWHRLATFSHEGLERSGYAAQHDLIERMRENPDHPRLVSDLVAREWNLDDEQRDFVRRYFAGLDRLRLIEAEGRAVGEQDADFYIDRADGDAVLDAIDEHQTAAWIHYGMIFAYEKSAFIEETLKYYRPTFRVQRALHSAQVGFALVAIYGYYKLAALMWAL